MKKKRASFASIASIASISIRYAAIALCAGLLLRCGRLPTDIGANGFSLQLALEDGTRTSATFSGQPITATITLADSVDFDSIAWHCGGGQVAHPGIAPSLKKNVFSVQLFWTSDPLCKDSATKDLFDTIYVSIHGESQRSNTVKVTVTNVAPVIDSVRIGTVSVRNSDTVRYVIPMTDTSSYILLRVGAHDMNRDTLRYDWYSVRGVTLSPVYLVSYPVPKTLFVDTLFVTVYDGKGGSAGKIIILSKLTPNHVPVIDSILAGARMYTPDSVMLTYSSRTLDTLKLHAFVHDTDAGDQLYVTWTKKNPRDSIARNTANSAVATLVFDSTYRKASDTIRVVDTVTVKVKDSRGDSAMTVIRIVYGHVNSAPKLDSIRVNGIIQCKGTVALSRDTAYGCTRAVLLMRIFSSDPDSGDTVKLTVRAKQTGAVTRISDTIAQYACKDSTYTDTVICVVKDISGDSAVKKIVVSVINRPPVLDSIRVNGVMQCRGPAAVLSRDTMIASSRDTFLIRVFTSDPDPGDTVKLSVRAKQATALTKLSDTTAQYTCKDSTYTDTVVCVVKDIAGDSAVKRVVVSVINKPPVLDSIRVNGVMQCKGAVVLSRDTAIASGRDTLSIRIFVHDPDRGDTVKLTVLAKQTAQITKLSDTTVRYVCKDSIYTDTIICVIKDLAGDSAVKRVVVSVINRTPILDSIRVNGVIQCRTTTVLSRDTAIASEKDTLALRIFAHDLDRGDTVKLSVRANQFSQVTVLSDTSARYICRDSVYSDTVVCVVKDLLGDSAVKRIIVSVINHSPRLDSIRVNGVMQCKGATASVIDSTSGKDTLMLRIFTSDPDRGDSVKFSINVKQASQFTRISDTTARYVCKDSLYNDTVLCVARDTKGDSAKKTVIIAVVNRLPKIDSLMVADTIGHHTYSFKSTDSLIAGRDTFGFKDSVRVTLSAHDPDLAPKDSIAQVQWTLTSGRTMKLLDTKGLFVQYPCPAAAATDTVWVRVTDTKQKSARTSMIFTIK
jgi:hypothetical protein